jgi:hypothetical protein
MRASSWLVFVGLLVVATSAGAQPRTRAARVAVVPAPSAALPLYEIDQALDDVTGRLAARLRLTWTNDTGAPLTVLPLRVHANAPAELGAAAGQSLTISSLRALSGPACTFTVLRPTLLEVRFASPIAPGASVQLELAYEARLRELGPRANDAFSQALSSIGSLASSTAVDYGLLARGDGISTVALGYPAVAPFVDGHFDTSPPARVGDVGWGSVARFRVRTVLPDGLVAVTNLVDQPSVARAGGTRLMVSEGEPMRDFVLVAARDLEHVEARVGRVRVASWYRARDAARGRAALDIAVASLGSFERRFGPYPWPELEVVESSLVGGAGGMELSGMVLIAGMLYRPLDGSQSQLASLMRLWSQLGGGLDPSAGNTGAQPASAPSPSADRMDAAFEFTVQHEVAHEWFAMMVTSDSGEYAAFDEPLAQYAAVVAYEDRHGAAAARVVTDELVRMNYALYRLLDGVDRAAQRDASSFRTSVEYAGLVYGKAPFAWLEARDRLGDARVSAILRGALAENKFGIVTPASWRASLTRAGAPASLLARLSRYLEQAHGDEDLGVDDSGDLVLRVMFPPEVAASLRGSTSTLGMSSRDLLRMVFGGGLGDDAPVGVGLGDPLRALESLSGLP